MNFPSGIEVLSNQETWIARERAALLAGIAGLLEPCDFKSRARKLFDACKRITGASAGYVALLNEAGDENEVLFLDAGGMPCKVDPALPMPVRGLRAQAYETNRAVYDNAFAGGAWDACLPAGHMTLRNVMFAPLRIDGRTVGLIGLANKPDDFTDEDALLASAFGDLAAAALRDVRTREALSANEAKLREAEKMQALGTMAGGIAHDFNNILTVISGHAELTRLELPEDHPARESLGIQKRFIDRAADLVRRILTFRCHDFERRRPIDVAREVREAIRLLRSAIPSTIAIREEVDDICGEMHAAPSQVSQAILNLGINAAQAMPEGGHLEISCRLDPASPGGGKRGVRLAVRDSGVGMTPEIMRRMYDPYFTTRSKEIGTGLGLSVVHGIVKSLEGTIGCLSEPGRGTTFEIVLPVSVAAQARSANSDAPRAARGRLLVVDDEPEIVSTYRRMLAYAGFEVVTSTDPVEALAMFRADPSRFDLLLSDLTMPGMTGETLAREVLRDAPDLPVILCTGYSGCVDREAAKAFGIRDYLFKPITMKELVEAIEVQLGGDGSTRGEPAGPPRN